MPGSWRTFTPDGRTLAIEHSNGEWIAVCEGKRAVGTTAHEAIAAAIGSEQASIGTRAPAIEAWVAAHAARLEAEAGL